ncbi:hypothetical protein GCM10027027_15400 [Neomicrococcus lactis]
MWISKELEIWDRDPLIKVLFLQYFDAMNTTDIGVTHRFVDLPGLRMHVADALGLYKSSYVGHDFSALLRQ